MKKANKLTSWEWKALTSECNLADGHAHQEQNKLQTNIINSLSTLYLEAQSENQSEIQSAFEEAFFLLAGQPSYSLFPKPLYHYGCSLAIEVVGNYLRAQNKSVTLLHPTFDNLADILKRHTVPLRSLEEMDLKKIVKEKADNLVADALFLVCPNNPTGFELNEEEFKTIVTFCKRKKILLILDLSFRFYSTYTSWDQYKILYDSGVDFIALEDTGKTWPTLDMKLGIMITSQSVYKQMQDITDDFLLNVSPFIFKLLTEYIKLEDKTTKRLFVNQTVIDNRKIFVDALQDTPLTILNPESMLSVCWIQLPDKWNASTFCQWLETKKIYVLPGNPFYWNEISRGEKFIRIALARPKVFIQEAAQRLKEACMEY